MITIYGIKQCDTVRKAMQWLADNDIAYELHDFRLKGVDQAWLAQAEVAFGWQQLVNKRSATWRNLPAEIKDNLGQSTALAVLAQNPTLIKRPIILQQDIALIGFDPSAYQQALK